MQDNIIDKLFTSFEELEVAIEGAKTTLAKRQSISPEILARLNSYDGILLKQRNLAKELCLHLNQGNWDEVSRYVSLINGLSAMIRDDARAILSQLNLNSDHGSDQSSDDDSLNFC
jgi:hypothetical protein